MQTLLDLKSDTASSADVLLTGERSGGIDWLRITLSNPHREIVICRSELATVMHQLWRPE